MKKQIYAREHDISPLYPVQSIPIRIPLIKLYEALDKIIADGFSDTVKISHEEDTDLYKSIHVSISNLALFFKSLLYHVHGEEKIDIVLSTNNFDAFIDVKCNYKFTKDEISELEAALFEAGFKYSLDGRIHLETPLRGCGAVTAYSFGTNTYRHYIYYVIHADMFKKDA